MTKQARDHESLNVMILMFLDVICLSFDLDHFNVIFVCTFIVSWNVKKKSAIPLPIKRNKMVKKN